MNISFIMMFLSTVFASVTAKRYPIWPFEFKWSFIGNLSEFGYNCILINEPEQPFEHYWFDNHLCHVNGSDIIDPGFKWSLKGAISNMKCTKIHEPGDTIDWSDNYLCVPNDSPYNFKFSFDGCVRPMDCISLYEPADPDFWWDNYLCNKRTGSFNETYQQSCIFGYTSGTMTLVSTTTAILTAVFISFFVVNH